MYLPDDLSPKPFNRSFWNSYVIQKKKTVRKLWDMIKVSTSIPKILRKLYGFPKKFSASLGKKIEIFRQSSIRTDILPKCSVRCPRCFIQVYYFDHIHDICQVIQQQCFDLTSAPLFFYQCPPFQWCNVFFCPLTLFAACPSTINGRILSAIKLVTRNAASRQAHTVNPALVHLALTIQSYERDKRHAWRHISMQKSVRFFRTTRKPRKVDF